MTENKSKLIYSIFQNPPKQLLLIKPLVFYFYFILNLMLHSVLYSTEFTVCLFSEALK